MAAYATIVEIEAAYSPILLIKSTFTTMFITAAKNDVFEIPKESTHDSFYQKTHNKNQQYFNS